MRYLTQTLWCALVLINIRSASTFNIDISDAERTAKLVRPYLTSPNDEITNPIFFGYNLLIKKGTGVSPR